MRPELRAAAVRLHVTGHRYGGCCDERGQMSERRAEPVPAVLLGLADDREAEPSTSAWVRLLLALGTRLSRKAKSLNGRQLIVVISVPSREFAAVLVGTGWTLTRLPKQTTTDPLIVLRTALTGGRYRAVNSKYVISGQLQGFDDSCKPARVTLAGGQWAIDRIVAAAPTIEEDPAGKMPRPKVGSIGRMTDITRDWEQRLVAPAADLAIVGTKSWINQDLEAILARDDDADGDAIGTLLLPKTDRSATWFTRIYSASGLADQLPLPDDLNLVILDGQGAIKYLNDILVPIVVCILDRSVADETAAEQVVQLRNSRGEPVSLKDQFGWPAPTGVEALAFTVAL